RLKSLPLHVSVRGFDVLQDLLPRQPDETAVVLPCRGLNLLEQWLKDLAAELVGRPDDPRLPPAPAGRLLVCQQPPSPEGLEDGTWEAGIGKLDVEESCRVLRDLVRPRLIDVQPSQAPGEGLLLPCQPGQRLDFVAGESKKFALPGLVHTVWLTGDHATLL